jgi:hypothetical protein
MDAKTAATLGRLLLGLAFLSLLGAWLTQLTGQPLWGLSQIHLFSDATVLSLLGIGALVDAKLHSQKI